MKIHIVLTYKDAESMAQVWAYEEQTVQFNHDFYRAARCTSAYAAMELKKYIEMTVYDTSISIGTEIENSCFNIRLMIETQDSKWMCFLPNPVNMG